MDTNEDREMCNDVEELLIQPLVPYPSSFVYEFSSQGLYLENSPSIWKEGDQQHKPQSFKRRRVEDSSTSTSSFLRGLDRDTSLHALSLLDIRSLIRCMLVEKSLKGMIHSQEVRRLWSKNQSPVVLISSHTLPCKLWVPGTSPSTTTLFHPLSTGLLPSNTPLVVASHRGLVCIRLNRSSRALDFAVGNPLTGEWVALPRSSKSFRVSRSYSYKMEVAEPQHEDHFVGFKVTAFATSEDRHFCYVFDSVTGEWSSTSLQFPPRTTFKWSAFDLRSSSWRTELIRSPVIKTGLERTPSEVHRLPHPSLHGFCQWEYKGRRYFASAWTVEQAKYEKEDSCGEFAGYGVWEVAKDGVLKTIAAVWGPELGVIPDAIRENIWGSICAVSCSGCESLVCFDGESGYSPAMPVVFYDIDSGRWTLFNEQFGAPDAHSPVDHYAAAVVYSPTLLVAPRCFRSKEVKLVDDDHILP